MESESTGIPERPREAATLRNDERYDGGSTTSGSKHRRAVRESDPAVFSTEIETAGRATCRALPPRSGHRGFRAGHARTAWRWRSVVASIDQRLKSAWQLEYDEWVQQDLSGLEVVYQWADGLYVKAGIAKERAALLVIIGALSDGRKVVLACESGQRESKESWSRILRNIQRRGLKLGRLTDADGHLGIWSALAEQHPEGQEQRCWNHKSMNVADHLPKTEQPAARQLLHGMAFANSRAACERKRDQFVRRYEKNYPKAAETLLRDWDRMITFYEFRKQHWVHLRTTNIVESPFDMVRLRTNAARRFKRVENATAMIWKLLRVAEKTWQHLKGSELLQEVYDGQQFADGIRVVTKSKAAA